MVGKLGQELAGCRVLITAQRRAGELGAALERRGASVDHAPVLSIVPHVDDPELIRRTLQLLADPPDIVVITTGVGLRGWAEAADAAGVLNELLALLDRSRLIARGPKARGAIQTLGLNADWVAESETSAEIKTKLIGQGVRGLRIAIQHHGAGSDGLDDAFMAAGAEVQSLVVYRWGPAPDQQILRTALRQVALRRYDAVAFTSAPGAAAFLEAARHEDLFCHVRDAFAAGMVAAAVGVVTAQPLTDAGITPLVPDRYRLGALVRMLVERLGEESGVINPTPAGELRVLRGAALLEGELLPLTPSSLSLLRLLAEAGGRVVGRDAILAVLPGGSADGHAVDVAVARLRENLGAPDLVRTVVKRGYRLAVVGR
ncbi:MAG: uroporphyrinogen-III synthase [Micropruina sp.]